MTTEEEKTHTPSSKATRTRNRNIAFAIAGVALLIYVRLFGTGGEGYNAKNSTGVPQRQGWSYTKTTLDGYNQTWARLYSSTDPNLPAPYDGQNAVRLDVSNDKSGASMTVDQGQFYCDDDSGKIYASFDNSEGAFFSCRVPRGYTDSNVIIQDTSISDKGGDNGFFNRMARSHKMFIRVKFFDAGERNLEFDTAGLDLSRLR